MDAIENLGREVSMPLPGTRRRLRGYVAEVEGGRPLVRLYPEEGNDFAECLSLEGMRLLKAAVPSGWRGIDVCSSDGAPAFSLRLRADVFRRFDRFAKREGLTFEQAFNVLIAHGLDQAEAEFAATGRVEALAR